MIFERLRSYACHVAAGGSREDIDIDRHFPPNLHRPIRLSSNVSPEECHGGAAGSYLDLLLWNLICDLQSNTPMVGPRQHTVLKGICRNGQMT